MYSNKQHITLSCITILITPILCFILSGCGCQDEPSVYLSFDRSPSTDTVRFGDTITLIDRSYCKWVEYRIYDSNQSVCFPYGSLIGSFDCEPYASYKLNRFYADPLSNSTEFDTTSRLMFKFIMNGDTGLHVVKLYGESTYTQCNTFYVSADNVPTNSYLYDTIYVKAR